MKEAAGEANITVITIVLIAVVLAVGTIVVSNVLNNTSKQSACTAIGGHRNGNQCCFNEANTDCANFVSCKDVVGRGRGYAVQGYGGEQCDDD